MEPYKDIGGDSGISAFELGRGTITIRFSDGGIYLYDGNRPGAAHVARMQALAVAGNGLNTYVNRHVRDRYAAKLA
jgi:hypothetical protein